MTSATKPHVEVVTFDAAAFDLDTVKKALYRFTAQFSADITIEGSRIICGLAFKPSATPQSIAGCVEELKKEVLDQDLRRKVSAETAAIRNAILALAFANPNLRRDE